MYRPGRGCSGQDLSLSAKLKSLPFTIHIFSSNRMPRRKTASTLPSVTQFLSPLARDRRNQSFYFSFASRPPSRQEMLIGHGLADNRIEKGTAEKANFVPELTRRSTTEGPERTRNSLRFLRRDATRGRNRISQHGNKKAAPGSVRLDLTARRLRAP
jgi:hypothetical protein